MSDLPRVSAILKAVGLDPDLSNVPPDALEAGRDRGKRVHEAIEAITYNYFDPASFPEEHVGYLDAFRNFLKDSGYQPQYAEVEVRHEAWRYRCHPDSIGFLDTRRVLLDWKSGGADRVEYQLEGNRQAWDWEHPTAPIHSVLAVQLRRDGSYRVTEHERADAVWRAALVVFGAQRRT